MYGNGGILKMLDWIAHAKWTLPWAQGPVLLEFQWRVQRGEGACCFPSSPHLGVALWMTTPEDPWSNGSLGSPWFCLWQSCPLFLVQKGRTLAKLWPVLSAISPLASSHLSWGVSSSEAEWFTFEFLMPKMSLYVVLCHSGHFDLSTHCAVHILSPLVVASPYRAGLTHPSLQFISFVALHSFQSAFMPLNILLICIKIQVPHERKHICHSEISFAFTSLGFFFFTKFPQLSSLPSPGS